MNMSGIDIRLVASLVLIAETSLVHSHLGDSSGVGYVMLLMASIVLWVTRGDHLQH